MVTFRELTLDDKKDFDRVLEKLQSDASDLNFSNFFMWGESYGLTVSYLSELDFWLLMAKPPKWKPFFFVPLGDWSQRDKLQEVLRLLRQVALSEGNQFFLRRVPEKLLQIMLELDPGLQFREDRNTFDYVYTTESLSKLSGRKLHAKRNQLNQFFRKYDWTYQTMNPEVAAECLQLATPWFNLQERNDFENAAMYRMLNRFEQLKLTGGVIRVNGQIQALTVGERLNRDTAVVHIEKANTEYDGIYAAINQQFVTNCWLEYTYINREEDLGLEGLRRVKLSYHPVRFVKKYNVY
ncbi:MAG TPA: phosphatidylglycerol lysyltransferase domain-containing protein [Bacillota bacterium]